MTTIRCAHYWIVETTTGSVSKGMCRLCGEEREFGNSVQSWQQTENIRPSSLQQNPSHKRPKITNRLRSLLYILAKLLVTPWRLATYQPSPPAGPARRRSSPVPAEEDVELGLYLLR